MKNLNDIYNYIRPLLSVHSFFQTVFFNLYFLPFKQAIKLPIWVYKPHFIKLKGKIKIESTNIRPGMIKLGFWGGHMYPNNGFYIMHEGDIIFKGNCIIGNNSFIITGKQGKIEFGDDFLASTSVKVISFIGVKFGDHTRLGWEGVVLDTNFHPLYDMVNKKFKKAYGRINIGESNWFGTGCLIMPSVETPKRCIFGARSVVTRGCNFESYSVHGGSPLKVLSRNVERIFGQDKITFYE